MKNVHLITQAKGGTGKSFITWFCAYATKERKTVFVDLDKSTRTSYKRLSKIIGPDRVAEMSIIDDNLKLDREMFINIFESISKSKTDTWFIDLGAPESDELTSFFENTFSAQELKAVLESIGINLKIYVVIAGGDAFGATVDYYQKIKKLNAEAFEVVGLKNDGTFKTIAAQNSADEVLAEMGIATKNVCKMPLGQSSVEIIQLIGNEINEKDLSLAGKLGLKKMVETFHQTVLS